ncbi:hypothetical protein HN446_02155 [bacterium]|jgi:hypothetical protein|nr:hypothetical protein [bacterium]
MKRRLFLALVVIVAFVYSNVSIAGDLPELPLGTAADAGWHVDGPFSQFAWPEVAAEVDGLHGPHEAIEQKESFEGERVFFPVLHIAKAEPFWNFLSDEEVVAFEVEAEGLAEAEFAEKAEELVEKYNNANVRWEGLSSRLDSIWAKINLATVMLNCAKAEIATRPAEGVGEIDYSDIKAARLSILEFTQDFYTRAFKAKSTYDLSRLAVSLSKLLDDMVRSEKALSEKRGVVCVEAYKARHKVHLMWLEARARAREQFKGERLFFPVLLEVRAEPSGHLLGVEEIAEFERKAKGLVVSEFTERVERLIEEFADAQVRCKGLKPKIDNVWAKIYLVGEMVESLKLELSSRPKLEREGCCLEFDVSEIKAAPLSILEFKKGVYVEVFKEKGTCGLERLFVSLEVLNDNLFRSEKNLSRKFFDASLQLDHARHKIHLMWLEARERAIEADEEPSVSGYAESVAGVFFGSSPGFRGSPAPSVGDFGESDIGVFFGSGPRFHGSPAPSIGDFGDAHDQNLEEVEDHPELSYGDQVRILSGPHEGEIGRIEYANVPGTPILSVNPEYYYVKFDDGSIKERHISEFKLLW